MSKQIYTEIILELYKNPPNRGRIEDFDLESSGGNPSCGDQTTFTMKIKDEVIEDVKFYGSGCAISVASEAILSDMVKGKKIGDAKKITNEEMLEKLGGIVQTRMKCALLGLLVVKKGIEEYEKNKHRKTSVKGTAV